jgi:organic radical activating enzyme
LPELADFFARRRGKLDGVVFSGGEPTLQSELAAAAGLAREAGFAIRLDTNGSRPAAVAAATTMVAAVVETEAAAAASSPLRWWSCWCSSAWGTEGISIAQDCLT